MKKIILGLFSIIPGVIIAFLPITNLLGREEMIYLGVLLSMVLLLIFRIFPEYITALLAIGCLATAGIFGEDNTVFSFNTLFAPFAQSTFWLIFFAFAINAAITSTGLIERFMPKLYRFFPDNHFGRLCFLMVTGTIFSPFIPSTNAKAALMTPCAQTIMQNFDYKKSSKEASGLFCAMLIPATVTAQAFFSGSGTVYIALGILGEKGNYSWLSWFGMTWLWLLLVSIFSLIAIFIIFRPEKLDNERKISNEITHPSITRDEVIAGITILVTLVLWITEPFHGISYVIVALFAFVVLAATNVFKINDLKKLPWAMLIFIGALLSMASLMGTLGVKAFLIEILSPLITPFTGNIYIFMAFVCILTYLSRFIIISQATDYAILYLVLAPFSEILGISNIVLMFVITASTNVWNLSFHNTAYLSAMASGGDTMVTHKDVLPMSYMYMAINLMVCLICIPLWQQIGMIG